MALQSSNIGRGEEMKGHNYGQCRKCNLFHEHPKGMLGKNHSEITKEKFKGRSPWQKGMDYLEYKSHYKNGFGGCKNKGKMLGDKNPSKRLDVEKK